MPAIKHTFSTLAAPPRLFEALSTTEGLQSWWCKRCELSAAEGGQHRLRFDKGGQPIEMTFELSESRTNERVVWTCVKNDNPAWVGSTLVWEIEGDEQGSELRFVHDNFADEGPGYRGTVSGWPRFVASLQRVAMGEAGDPL